MNNKITIKTYKYEGAQKISIKIGNYFYYNRLVTRSTKDDQKQKKENINAPQFFFQYSEKIANIRR